jgi:hypothetical protein
MLLASPAALLTNGNDGRVSLPLLALDGDQGDGSLVNVAKGYGLEPRVFLVSKSKPHSS